MSAQMAVEVGGVRMRNPILLASGTVGYGEEVGELIDLACLGGIVLKGLSREPWIGNVPQRIAETPGGMLNSIGLQNIGVEAFVRDKLPALRPHGLAVVANVWGRTIEDYVAVAQYLDEVEGVDGLELNVSCPNIKEGGIAFGTSETQIHRVTAAVREATDKPLWVKLAPGVTDIGAIGKAAEEGGADALSVINTIRGMMINVSTRRPVLSTVFGGFSGPALFPLALYCLFEVKSATSVPLVGIGGIGALDQVLQFLIAGATAVQIGTANFYDPTVSQRLVQELEDWLGSQGLTCVDDLVGTLELPAPR